MSPAAADDAGQSLSALRAQVLDSLSTLDAGEILSAHNGPVRLINALVNGLAPGITVAQALADPDRLSAAMMRWRNLGRRSVIEAQDAFRRGVVAHFSRLGWPESVGEAAFDLLAGRALNDLERDMLEAALAGAAPPGGAPRSLPPDAVLMKALDVARERDRDVIVRRFGLGGRRQTLEEIGEDYGVTRERVRQIEAKALRGLRLRHRPELQAAIHEFSATAWRQLAVDRVSISASALPHLVGQLCPWFQLALELCGLTLAEWLDDYAQRWKQGWAEPWLSFERLQTVDRAIVAAQVERCLPLAVNAIADEDPELIIAVARLQPGLRIHGGYIISQHLGARLRRTLGLHAILGNAGHALAPADLLARYVAAFPEDPCNFRDIELVVAQWPHLFCEVTEGVWEAVGVSAPLALAAERLDEAALVDDAIELDDENVEHPDEGEDPGDEATLTLAGALEGELRRSGPTRLADLLDRAPAILPPGRSTNSIGPTLLLYKDRFLRGLPGLYALVGQLPTDEALLKRPPPYMLQDDVVRGYILARRAGEEFGAFPLWRPASEVIWCEWARQEADSPLFESLMSVIRPAQWPVESERRALWEEMSKRRGAFRIGFPPNAASVVLPPLDRVMAALKVVVVDGVLGWTKANRILMRRVRDHQSAGLLAVLVAFGALQPAADWQAPHYAGATAEGLLAALDDVCSSAGVLHWESELGVTLMERLRQAPPLGWVTADVLAAIISRWVGGAELLAQMQEPPLSALDQLLKEQAFLEGAEGLDDMLRAIAEGQGA